MIISHEIRPLAALYPPPPHKKSAKLVHTQVAEYNVGIGLYIQKKLLIDNFYLYTLIKLFPSIYLTSIYLVEELSVTEMDPAEYTPGNYSYKF